VIIGVTETSLRILFRIKKRKNKNKEKSFEKRRGKTEINKKKKL